MFGINKESSLIKKFVESLKDQEKQIAIAYIHLPNTAACQPEFMGIYFKYGKKLCQISDKIEALRVKVGCDYSNLQRKLQDLLPR